jgi:DNA replication ATP-dependent helicase Dna2
LEAENEHGATQKSVQAAHQVMLRQSWFDSPCSVGSFVHIFGNFDSRGVCIVDDKSNMIILHPDHLISATVVADSFGCMRRAVLQDRVKATGVSSAPMLYGTVLHELFQEALKINTWDSEILKQMLDEILPRHYETIADISLNLNQVHEHLIPKLVEMKAWASTFVRGAPGADNIAATRNGGQIRVSVNKLLDVEEHVWSPNYGLKGNIDATVQIVKEQDGKQTVLTVPFEIKTGKRESEAHQAQTALYTLLVSDRYDLEVTDGILYYLETSNTIHITAIRNEIIHMIMKRNELATFIRERKKLPPMLEGSKQRLCNGCYAKPACHLYHKLSEEGDGSMIEKPAVFHELVARLKLIHQRFFQKWDDLITKEESEVMKFRRELWTMLSKDREKVHRCFSEVIIAPDSTFEQQTLSKINRFQYVFVKQNSSTGFSFTESQIIVGDPIVVSDERGHFALARGYVTSIHRRQIAVAVDRRLHNSRIRKSGFNSQTNQTFSGIMEIDPQSSALVQDTTPVVYRIDKDEFSNGMAAVRNNILQIMDDKVFKAIDLRALLIEGREPQFAVSSSAELPTQSWVADMNTDQKAAVEKIMSAQDYALVLGMPGTGKTTTIAQIIQTLVAKGKSVLLTSYTHTAVDNILLKLRNAGIDILRLGVRAKIHPEVQEFAILGSDPKNSIEELKESWVNPAVVATTCLGINHPVFSHRTFDYCIVDEASQITLPVCLGPIRMAKKFVLVGDHYQLPPLVQNKEAQEGGLDVSLFKLLSDKHPDAVVSLEHQYRMCAEIMTLPNTLIYSGRLKCGTDSVATRRMDLPEKDSALSILHPHARSSAANSNRVCAYPSNCLMASILDPSQPVLFLNTDTVGDPAKDISHGSRIVNPFEARLTVAVASALLSAGLSPRELGIVTFWRSQASLLRNLIGSHGNTPSSAFGGSLPNALSEVELHTADKFQGRDKEVILVSFVRSNTEGNVGDLLKDWRRINVAITRARSKLVLVGSANTLRAAGDGTGADCLRGLVDVCSNNGWTLPVEVGVLEKHDMGALGSQIDSTGRIPRQYDAKASPKRGTISDKIIAGGRPIVRDILNDILDESI